MIQTPKVRYSLWAGLQMCSITLTCCHPLEEFSLESSHLPENLSNQLVKINQNAFPERHSQIAQMKVHSGSPCFPVFKYQETDTAQVSKLEMKSTQWESYLNREWNWF